MRKKTHIFFLIGILCLILFFLIPGTSRAGTCIENGCSCIPDDRSCPSGSSVNSVYRCDRDDQLCCCPSGGGAPPPSSDKIKLNLTYPTFEGYNPGSTQFLNQVIAWFYYFVVIMSGFFAFFGMVVGGFSWLTSGGNPSRIAEAKEQILAAILGLIIILASYVILQIINPELTTLNLHSL